jgi:biotin carboxyl carrier protein
MLQIKVNDHNTFRLETTDGITLLNSAEANPDISLQPGGLISILHNSHSYTALVERVDTAAKEVDVRINGQLYTTSIQEPIDLLLNDMGLDMKASQKAKPITAPMPGMVLKVLVSPGQQVNKGDGLIILEAMKMENVLKATTASTVKAVKAIERTAVEKGAILIELE